MDIRKLIFIALSLLCNFAYAQTEIVIAYPQEGSAVQGSRTITGYAVASTGIDNLELYVDGVYVSDVPIGAKRNDVARVYPSFPDADKSGFAYQYHFKSLSHGSHQLKIIAISNGIEVGDTSVGFTVEKASTSYLWPYQVNLSGASASVSGNTVVITGAKLGGASADITIAWDRVQQIFATTGITLQNDSVTFSPVGNWSGSYTASGAGESCTFNLSLSLYGNGTGNVYSSLVSDDSPSIYCVSSTGDFTWTFDGSHVPVYVTNSSASTIGGDSFNFSIDVQNDALKLVDSSNWYGVEITRQATLYRN